MTAGHILVVDDEADIRETISEILADEGYAVRVAASAAAARDEVRRARPDLVLLDVWMPDVDGISLLREWHDQGAPRCPVVILSGHGTVETAVEATRLGAVDFVEKPLSLTKLLRTVQKALEGRSDHLAAVRGRGAPVTAPVGRGVRMRALREQARVFAPQPDPLLISGEPGTGRAVLARHVHALGGDGRPFVVISAAACPDDNVAAVLLGAGGGAEPGALARAAGGTLLVRDVQDLGTAGQQLLAGVVAQGSYTPLGAATPQLLAARLVTTVATGAPLPPELRARLGVLELVVPALRDRTDDIPDLLRHAVDTLVDAEGLPFRRFSLAAQNRLRNYPWPGNVRELENLVRRLLLAGGPEEIGLPELEQHLAAATPASEPLVKQDLLALPLREAREAFERAYLTEQLALCGGRVGALAKRVGMERTHLYRKLRSLGVDFRTVQDDD
jgi:DNA-binding NtrC family response regulator